MMYMIFKASKKYSVYDFKAFKKYDVYDSKTFKNYMLSQIVARSTGFNSFVRF